ncbi:MAG: FlgD immunoglobulin-like domain containing protein [Candidatus Edwardsbacteria bacterium]|nr:FlgD immunoglobulin-like domain containing protein [Candidatus Edwardsbacteria bacterium]
MNYQLTKPGLVNLTVYNTAGQLVKTLVNAYCQPGSYAVNWDCTGNDKRKVANGVYLARLESNGRAATSKMVVIK